MLKPNPSESNTIFLPDGRTLGYAVYGVPFPHSSKSFKASPTRSIRTVRFCDSIRPQDRHEDTGLLQHTPSIIYCHGVPGSRVEASPLHSFALSLGIRILSIDRPGIGLSSPLPGRKVLDFATDVKDLLAYLRIKEFHVLAYSAGAPYALGIGHAFFRRQQEDSDEFELLGVGTVAGLAPWSIIAQTLCFTQRLLANVAYWCPSLLGYMLERELAQFARQCTNGTKDHALGAEGKTPDLFQQVVQRHIKCMDTQSQKILLKPEIQEVFVENLREAYKGEMESILQDVRLMVSEWGFGLADIKHRHEEEVSPRIKLWYGGRDTNVSLAQGEAIHQALVCTGTENAASLTVFPYDTHFSILIERGERIVSTLVGS